MKLSDLFRDDGNYNYASARADDVQYRRTDRMNTEIQQRDDAMRETLKHGYYEERMEKSGNGVARIKRWHRPGSVLLRRANVLHRVELQFNRRPAWTLVFCGPRGREWGFQTPTGWVAWREYLAQREAGT